MTEIAPIPVEFPKIVDNSMLNTFRACPQQFFRTYMQHWKHETPSIHLHFGKCFAAALEMARRAFYIDKQDPETALALAIHSAITEWGERDAGEDGAKSLSRLCGALEYYFSVWPLDTDPAQPVAYANDSRGIEFSFVNELDFQHPVSGLPLLYSGRADMVVQLANGIFIEDDKTATSLGPSWTKKWELRSQFTGYAWALQRAGKKPDGVLVRGVSILKTKYDHAQALTFRAQWEIDRWYEQTIRDLGRMQRAWEENYWDFNLGDSCDGFGACDYVQVCKAQRGEEWLPIQFRRRRWDPLTRTEIELAPDQAA